MRTEDKGHLTPTQQDMVKTFERHVTSELLDKNLETIMATMIAEPHVNLVPVMTGGIGQEGVRHFYRTYFLPGIPPDTEIIPVSRTVGRDRIVDELIHKFTHSIEVPWMLPGIPPTGKRVQIAVVAVIEFQDGKIASEHIYWDQASLLAQIGLIDTQKLPVVGADSAEKVLNPSQQSFNTLIDRARHQS